MEWWKIGSRNQLEIVAIELDWIPLLLEALVVPVMSLGHNGVGEPF